MDYKTYNHWLTVKKYLEDHDQRDSGIYIAACQAIASKPYMPPYPNSDARITHRDVF
jgi:hypothetical protein